MKDTTKVGEQHHATHKAEPWQLLKLPRTYSSNILLY